MSKIDYEDFAYTSEEEKQQTQERKRFNIPTNSQQDDYDLFENDKMTIEHGVDFDEDGSSKDSNSASDEDNDSDDNPDIDEYASYATDLKKHQYDQLRWNGILNPRKYTIAPKKKTGEGKGQKESSTKEEKPETAIKPGNQDKPKALPKPRRKRKSMVEAPLGLAPHIPKEEEIHFDNRENLWYSYKKNEVYVSERATFHHWIRPALTQIQNIKGTYDFPRKRGSGSYDTTCFNEVEEHWGPQRPHYAPVMFEWERRDRENPEYQLDNLYYQKLLVLDYWRMPIRNFREIPLVISSAFEGAYMEPATRLHSEMAYEDIRARMPPFVQITKDGVTKYKALSKSSTFSGRSRHFREVAGAISWDKREGSENIKSYIANIVKPVNNSTQGSRDLSKAEVAKLRLSNFGTKPGRAKQGTSEESKKKYKAEIERAAGLTPVTILPQKVEGENEDHDGVYEDEDDQVLEGPLASLEDANHQEEAFSEADINDAAPPRFVFRCIDHPFLQAMTEEEALMHPMVDISDPRNHIPKFSNEVLAICDALRVTINHFVSIFGYEPVLYKGGNYISEYCNIQDQMDDFLRDDSTALLRLGRWEGTVFDWERAVVEHDPCIGRRQPFGSVFPGASLVDPFR